MQIAMQKSWLNCRGGYLSYYNSSNSYVSIIMLVVTYHNSQGSDQNGCGGYPL